MAKDKDFATMATSDWDALQVAVERFETAWGAGTPPTIEAFLPAKKAGQVPLLVELIHVDLERRLKLGEATRIEAYLERFPELTARRDVVVKLIAAEFEQRRRREPKLLAAEYLRRFPKFHAEVAKCLPTDAAEARISFSCSKCGMKFNVLPEFAGRKTTCPTCKEALVVPSPDQTVAYVPPAGQIDGLPSSLARARVNGGVTLGGGAAGKSSLQELLEGDTGGGARYVIEKELARGGMGAVLRAVDCDIRREVALKYLLDQSNANNKLRFIEEAQITGQLEHPNIVPIHELGVDSHKRIFFTMKMVKGRSVAQILKMLRDKAADAEKEYTLSRLLSILVNVCNALAYAHSRGVVHRDLKPANIMVGDFGEVYVMDWGLAKVLDKSTSMDTSPPMAIPVAALAVSVGDDVLPLARAAAPLETPPSSGSRGATHSSGAGKVVTSRDADTDLTQAGDVLGTPVYMPPEQATGQIDRIDERSDIYSMGAILYEMLTLQQPIDRAGGFRQIVLRVSEGQIEAPEKKTPERARAGRIPPELAAVAMKALAKNKHDRYQTIESFRTDIERFVEGRSVTAKQDTIREMAVKLVKRNMGVSIATAAAAAILAVVGIWSLIAIVSANARTRAEELTRREQAKRSVPSLVRAAKMLINENQLDDAFMQVDTAVGFDEDAVDPRFLRAQLQCGRAEYAAAQADLERCVKLMPDRAECARLLEAVKKTRADNSDTVLSLAVELSRQKAFAAAAQATRNAEKLVGSRKEMLAHFQARLDAAWPRLGSQLTCNLESGELTFLMTQFNDLSPLRGLPLNVLVLNHCHDLEDLTPLKGMPLTRLNLDECTKVSDLRPLRGMPLVSLSLYRCVNVPDLAPLRGMQLQSLNLKDCAHLSDLTPLKGMRLTELNLNGCSKVSELAVLKGMPLKNVDLGNSPHLTDLRAVEGMPLTELNIAGCGKVTDLTPVKGMKLTYLNINGCPIRSLTPLQGMSLTSLEITGLQVTDLEPLRGMPLTSMGINAPLITDLEPLRGMKITSLNIQCKNVAELAPLAGMPLTDLRIYGAAVKDLSPLKDMPLGVLHLADCENVRDLTPLAGMNLGHILLPPNVTKGMEVLRAMKTLVSINGQPPAEFWKNWDEVKAK